MRVLSLLCVLLIAATAHAGWEVKKGKALISSRPQDYDFTAINSAKKLEIVGQYVPDTIYDLEKIEVPADVGKLTEASSDAEKKKGEEAAAKAMKALPIKYNSSLTLRVLLDKKVLFTSIQGKTPDLEKIPSAPLTDADAKLYEEAIKDLEMTDNTRAMDTIKGIPKVFSKALSSLKSAKEVASTEKGKTKKDKSPSALLSIFEKGRRTQVGNYRYYVLLYTAAAFYVTPGHHSGTTIALVNEDTGLIHEIWEEGNHGRRPSEGLTYKCTHTGVVFNDLAQKPVNWHCSTTYWAFWCWRGPNWNCNAQAKYQMDIADAPTAPPAANTRTCATYCPIRSYDC